MNLIFSSATEENLVNLPAWAQKVNTFLDYTRDAETRCQLAYLDDKLVGVVAWWIPRIHQSEYFFELAVAPEHRRQGIGTAMYKHARSQALPPIPFMMRDYIGEVSMAFADSLGAETQQLVPPSIVRTSASSKLRSAEVLPATAVSRETYQDAYVSFYEWTHEDWSPVSGDHVVPLKRDGGTDTYNYYSSIAVDQGGSVLALVGIFLEDAATEMVGETTSRHIRQGELLVEACLKRSLAKLHEMGIETVEADGHISDPHWLPALVKAGISGRWFRLAQIPPENT